MYKPRDRKKLFRLHDVGTAFQKHSLESTIPKSSLKENWFQADERYIIMIHYKKNMSKLTLYIHIRNTIKIAN